MKLENHQITGQNCTITSHLTKVINGPLLMRVAEANLSLGSIPTSYSEQEVVDRPRVYGPSDLALLQPSVVL